MDKDLLYLVNINVKNYYVFFFPTLLGALSFM